MPISNIIRSLVAADGARNAAKVPELKGYLVKTTDGLSEEEIAAGKFKLVFVNADGDQYVFAFDGSGYAYVGFVAGASRPGDHGEPDASVAFALDGEIFTALVGDNWTIGSRDAFEAARTAVRKW